MDTQFFPRTSDQTPWRTAILSLIPFIFIGPLFILVGYYPSWNSQQVPWFRSLYWVVATLLIGFGMVLGVLKKFPRWSYPYAIYSLILLNVVASYFVSRTILVSLLLIGLPILASVSLQAFRPFYTNIRQDWTLLSYGLYACTIFILALVDGDDYPTLNFLALMPSIIGILGALVHLRLTSSLQRVLVLELSMLVGVIVWTIPIFNGMLGSWESLLVALGYLVVAWCMLAALILVPLLVGIFSRSPKMLSPD